MLPESNDQHLWVSWESYHRSIEKLALMVHESGWKFDQVLCLARGGLRPGDVFSRIFDVPLAILSTSSYREEAGTVRGSLDIAKFITMTRGALAGRVLLVDDLVDSGVTNHAICASLATVMPPLDKLPDDLESLNAATGTICSETLNERHCWDPSPGRPTG